MTKTELFEIILNGETSVVEFKNDAVETHRVARELVGFLNSFGGALLLGVEDDGVSWCRYGSGFHPFFACVLQKPRALPWAGMAPAFGLQSHGANGATPYQPGATPQERYPQTA